MCELSDRVKKATEDIRRIRLGRRLLEYPEGHPEEPAELKKFREQNPDWRELTHECDGN